jgi:hypothetical protein
LPEARGVRPAFLYDPLREIETYRSILMPSGLSAPRCLGAWIEPGADRYWLFLERVPGSVLAETGSIGHWRAAVLWLAEAHALLGGDADRWARAAPLIRYDAEFYRVWPRRALRFLGRAGTPSSRRSRRALARICERYETVINRLMSLPVTVIHGEFYASNVITSESGAGPRVHPVDWETAALGPGLVDVAALLSGSWEDATRETLVRDYHAAAHERGLSPPGPVDRVMSDLVCCRLHIAMQWLGWADGWFPPPSQSHDWLSEAVDLAEELGL